MNKIVSSVISAIAALSFAALFTSLFLMVKFRMMLRKSHKQERVQTTKMLKRGTIQI
jgi:hypothetical protein